jgi:hypothetical protein
MNTQKIAGIPRYLLSDSRIEHIRQVKKDNPDANQKWIATICFESTYAVRKALRGLP